MEDLYIIGAGQTSEAVCGMIEDEQLFNIKALCVDPEYLSSVKSDRYDVLSTEDLPQNAKVFVALGYRKLNHDRYNLFKKFEEKSFQFVNVISKNAIVRNSVKLGRNVLVMELNNVQAHCSIGDGSYLWSANHIGHHTTVGCFNYISSHCVISGNTEVGDYNFVGVNTSVADGISVGSGCIIDQASVIRQRLEDYSVLTSTQSEVQIKSLRFNQRLLK